jgi:nucleotide-binding universal stress UspA family protein
MCRSILVPLDGSVFGEHALPYALGLARRAGAALHLAHVHVLARVPALEGLTPYPLHDGSTYDDDGARRADELAYLERLRLRLQPPGACGYHHLEGPVADRLEECGRAVGADFVVMTTHGRTGMSRAWLGSVADELVRRTCLPVLLVRPTAQRPELRVPRSCRRILVPLDGSPLAEQALAPALELGAAGATEVVLVRVIARRPGLAGVRARGGEAALRRAVAETYLAGIAAHVRDRGFACRVVVAAADPASGILAAARRLDVDAIALATHGRGGLSRLLMGSVADRVLRAANLPILLYRPGGQQRHGPQHGGAR